ncbi:MAG: helicase-related protein [candidate division WOR-3 bacterium]|nr:helicase-related protein [candidate division WOR-3 bacterium]
MSKPPLVDVDDVLSGLKDFQRKTVDYVFRRMYLDGDRTRRFLIADEVGLGKTLVAKGVIARAIEHLEQRGVGRIDIVYICSNADIARQNIRRLNVAENVGFELADRITLLPKTLSDLEGRALNFVSFTPGTSFDLKGGLGRYDERALLCCMLDDIWHLPGTGKCNVLQGNVEDRESFRGKIWETRQEGYDKELVRKLEAALTKHDQEHATVGEPGIKSRFEELCRLFRCRTKPATNEEWSERREIVGELRSILAAACMDALQPDLIIMDEFQRFKHLLTGEDDASRLAQTLFNYSDSQTEARVLLLSATPYRMYTISGEGEEGDHYEDFIATLRFLQDNTDSTEDFRRLLAEYRREIYLLGIGKASRLHEVKAEMEERLRRVMVRTERLAASVDRDGMLREHLGDDVRLESTDVQQYVALNRIATHLDCRAPLEYWKSAPYLLNFMDDYSMKEDFIAAAEEDDDGELARLVSAELPLLLSSADVRKYRALDPANARLRKIMSDTVGHGAWRLLWMPPSMPYYRLDGPFGAPEVANLTKRLVFSSWKVVPKAVAALVSYEAERLMMKAFDAEATNTAESRKRQQRLLRFSISEGRLTGMPLLSLIYPADVLASKCDPLVLYQASVARGAPPTKEEAIESARQRISTLLRPLRAYAGGGSVVDERWYWAAPALLDIYHRRRSAERWLDRRELAAEWRGDTESGEGEDEADTAWERHVRQLKETVAGFPKREIELGPMPPDIDRVLAELSIGAPGVVMLRALRRLVGSSDDEVTRTAAARTAYGILAMFNRPEAAAMIRSINRDEPYWRRVVEYCVAGGLQAVMDEYCHVLLEHTGSAGKAAVEVVDNIADVVVDASGLRAAPAHIDEIRVTSGRVAVDSGAMQVRCRFATRFGDSPTSDEGAAVRADQVRAAFNSPFWPFIVTSTSVGQEGLDFHCYCHAIVHWNLPSNPVDLEQREGRIHRYKGHAVRKNVAARFAKELAAVGQGDPWQMLFDAARAQRPADASDLVPYWVFKTDNGACIERHIPVLPLSRDYERYAELLRSLACYRMIFGQTRQDDIMAYLLRFAPEFARSEACKMMMDLSPR